VRLRLNITQSARRVSEQHYYSEKCAAAASQFLNRFYMSDRSFDDMPDIFLQANMMIINSEYHRVYTRDQRDWLEDLAKRWSDEEAIEKEFYFLRPGGDWLFKRFPEECSQLDYGAIEVGLKRWMKMQNDREQHSRVASKSNERNSSSEELGASKVKML